MKRGFDIVQALLSSKRSKTTDPRNEKPSPASEVLTEFAASASADEVTIVEDHDTRRGPIEPIADPESKKVTPKAAFKPKTPQERKVSTKKAKKRTPLDQQFIDLKAQYPDCILAIQVGYKYKFFGVDAGPVSKILNIMFIPGNLTADDESHDKFAYCSIPDVRLHIHLQRLLTNGLKVAVVSQTESAVMREAESSKGLFQREVTAIYTKATYIDEGPGDYITCILWNNSDHGAVTVHPCTGEIVVEDFSAKEPEALTDLQTYLHHLRPSEVLLIVQDVENVSIKISRLLKSMGGMRVTHKPIGELPALSDTLSADMADYYTENHSKITTLCIAQLSMYLRDFGLEQIFTVTSNVAQFSTKTYMNLAGNTLKALEVFQNSLGTDKGTLLWHIDHTHTKMGRRMLQRWLGKPLVDAESIQNRLDAVEALMDYNYTVEVFEGIIKKVGKDDSDWEKSLIKIHYAATGSQNRVTRKEVVRLLLQVQSVIKAVGDFEASLEKSNMPSLLKQLFGKLLGMASDPIVTDLLSRVNINAVYRDDLDEQRREFFDIDAHPLQGILAEKSAISIIEGLLQDELEEIKKVIKKPVEYLTVSKEPYLIAMRGDSGPKDWHKISATKTVTRYRTPKVSKLYKELLLHQEKLMQQCDEAFGIYLLDIDSYYSYFSGMVKTIAEIDCLLSLKTTSSKNSGYVKPVLSEEQKIEATKSRNPVIENFASNSYVANDINLSYDANRVLVITGPNMGGKSSYVKQVALLAIMTQVGCFLPCHAAVMGVFDTILVRMGAEDNILRGESTFMVEMLDCSSIIQNITEKSLVILDEIGRGTGTDDGIAIAYAIVNYLIEDARLPLTLFITHYPSLKVLEDTHPSVVANYHMGFMEVAKEDQEWPDVIFLYTLKRGVVSNLYGLNVARLAGIPTDIIVLAHKVAETLKRDIERTEICSIGSILRSNKANTAKVEELERVCHDL